MIENKTREERLLEKLTICKLHNRELLKEPSLLKIEIGKLQSEKQELEYNLEQEKLKSIESSKKYNEKLNPKLTSEEKQVLNEKKQEFNKELHVRNLVEAVSNLKKLRKAEHKTYIQFKKEYVRMRNELIYIKSKL